jgi:hypothetical protein
MMSNISKLNLFFLLKFLTIIQGFIPHPSIRVGGQAGESKLSSIQSIQSKFFS